MIKPKFKNKERRISKNFCRYLTKLEKQILFYKFLKEGLNKEQANLKIKKIVFHLSNLVESLKQKEKSEQEINMIFQEEFAKLRYCS